MDIIDSIWNDLSNKIEVIDKIFPDQPNEIEEGNKEYKWKIFPTKEEIEGIFQRQEYNRNIDLKCNKLASQMNYRLCEGDGSAVYILGVRDEGTALGISKFEMYKTILFIISAANIIDAQVNKIRLYRGIQGSVATIRISSEYEKTI